MFERLRTFHQEFMAQFKDMNWQDGFTGLNFQWWQYSIQTIWYVSILIYKGKVFWCKIYVWRSKTLTCLQISISQERLNSFDDSSFIYDFQSFSIDFPSQIWLYSRTSLFRTRLIRSPRYFEGRSNALGFTLPFYASPVISKLRYFELFFHFPWDFEIAGFDCILSLKKRPGNVQHWIVAERVLNVSGKLYTNVLNHTTRKNNILIILS